MNKKRSETGSGNVFKDIGVPNAEEHLIKAQLVFKIDTILKKRGLKQVEAAYSASASPMCRRCCAASSASSPSNACCAFWSRSITTWRLS
jgi:Helix-turn-helix domain